MAEFPNVPVPDGISIYKDFKNLLIKTICIIVHYAILTAGNLLCFKEKQWTEVLKDVIIIVGSFIVIDEMLNTVIESLTIQSFNFIIFIGAFFMSSKMVLDVLSTTNTNKINSK